MTFLLTASGKDRRDIYDPEDAIQRVRDRLRVAHRYLVTAAGRRCENQATDTGDLTWTDQYGFTQSTFISLSTMLPSNTTSRSLRYSEHTKRASIQKQQNISLLLSPIPKRYLRLGDGRRYQLGMFWTPICPRG